MYTVIQIVNLTKEYLEKIKVPHPRKEAEELVGEALGIGRMGVYLNFDRPLIDSELELCRSWLARRGKREPLQYIFGKVRFYHCDIRVSSDVLIPRQETEILVDKIVKVLEKESRESRKGKVLLDLCSGSGCIGISLKKRFPELHVVLSDVSSKALAIAIANAKENDVEVECLEGDLLTPFRDRKADFIVCNPPYIAEKELATLDEEVRLYEPKLALIGGVSGLEFYARLAEEMPGVLAPRGMVWLEIGTGQKEGIEALFSSSKWRSFQTECDFAGHDRFFSLEME